MKLDTDDPAIEALGRHLIAHGLEAPNEMIYDSTDDDVEYDLMWDKWTIEGVETDDSSLIVHATQETTQAEQVARRTHHHPAEYKHHDVTIYLSVEVDWSEHALAGETDVYIEQEGGRPKPPEPDIDAYRHDDL